MGFCQSKETSKMEIEHSPPQNLKQLSQAEQIELLAPLGSTIYNGKPKINSVDAEAVVSRISNIMSRQNSVKDAVYLPPLLFPSGSIYVGNWREDKKMHGKGEIYMSNGSYFLGDFEKSQPISGIIVYTNGDQYSGFFKELSANGNGTFTSTEGFKYEGKWLNDKMHHTPESADGVMARYSKDRIFKFEGWYENGQKQGKGILEVFGCFKYEGNFKDDQATGEGVLKFLDNSQRIYSGFFQGNKKQGFGIFKWPNLNAEFQGHYFSDKKQGMGKMTFMNGMVYEGQFKSGLMHGDGKIKMLDGYLVKVKFMNDQFIQKIEISAPLGKKILDEMTHEYFKEQFFQLQMEDYQENLE